MASAHVFVENKCEVCHQREGAFRAHVSEQACLTCHAAPDHAMGTASAASPDCASCHREHQGRVRLAETRDTQCVQCHASSKSIAVGKFPESHPQFAVLRAGAKDQGTLRFNHEVHAKPDLHGPSGPETLECATCHKPQLTRVSSQRKVSTGLMAAIDYEQQCARCHPLFFDARIDAEAPHEKPAIVQAFVRRSLEQYIAANPRAIADRDVPDRRIPLNFPPDPEPAARTPQEWVTRRSARAESYLFQRACAYCHGAPSRVDDADGSGPEFPPVAIRASWMPKARFDHAPHLMVECASCHTGAAKSRETADVLMPPVATCATCHSPSKGASSQCAECHAYHDWSKAAPIRPQFKLTDFQ